MTPERLAEIRAFLRERENGSFAPGDTRTAETYWALIARDLLAEVDRLRKDPEQEPFIDYGVTRDRGEPYMIHFKVKHNGQTMFWNLFIEKGLPFLTDLGVHDEKENKTWSRWPVGRVDE